MTLRRIFAAPAVIALVSLAGLVAALVGDGAWDVAGWLGLLAPFVALAWTSRRRG